MGQTVTDRCTGLVCEERATAERPDRVEYIIGWKPFWVANDGPLVADFKRILTEQALAHQPVSISYDRETRRITAVSRSAFRVRDTEGPPPKRPVDRVADDLDAVRTIGEGAGR